jgi:phage tail tape-measure protein
VQHTTPENVEVSLLYTGFIVTRLSFGVVALIAFTGLMPGATTPPKKTAPPAPSKTRVVAAAKSKKPVRASTWRPAASGKSTRRTKTVRTATATRSYTPQQPSPERYQQIQQALVEKGYYKGEPNGQWSADSAEALKRFQSDQNLTSDGKLNSLSLIALGLGPKRNIAQGTPVPAKVQPSPAPPVSPEPGVRP